MESKAAGGTESNRPSMMAPAEWIRKSTVPVLERMYWVASITSSYFLRDKFDVIIFPPLNGTAHRPDDGTVPGKRES